MKHKELKERETEMFESVKLALSAPESLWCTGCQMEKHYELKISKWCNSCKNAAHCLARHWAVIVHLWTTSAIFDKCYESFKHNLTLFVFGTSAPSAVFVSITSMSSFEHKPVDCRTFSCPAHLRRRAHHKLDGNFSTRIVMQMFVFFSLHWISALYKSNLWN